MRKYSALILIIVLTLLMNTTVFAQNTKKENTEPTVIDDNSLNSISSEFISPDIESYINESNAILKGTGDNIQVEGVFLNEFSSYYFSQLQSNFGLNHKGTCSYIAAAMLLSYYDTYWDDNIILSQYDEIIDDFDASKGLKENLQSPGIKGDEEIIDPTMKSLGVSLDGELDDSVYYSVVSNYASKYFHFNLLEIGRNQLNKSNSMYPWDIEELLRYYLYNERGYDSSQVTVERKKFDTQDNLKLYIIEKVDAGIPVIVCAGYWELGLQGHSFIIYDYDEENDEMYCHLGIKNGEYHVKFSTIEYSTIGGVISLYFRNEHSCSNNYVDSNGNAYCSCYFPCHPEHEHTYEQIEGDASQHKYTCGCVANDVNTAYHSFTTYESVDETYHTKTCADCGYTETEAHDYEDYDSCYEKCTVCGYKNQIAEHDYSYSYAEKNSEYHYAYCECGAKAQLEHEFTSLSQLLDVCKYCKIEKDHVHEYTYRFCKDGETHIKSCSCGISTIEQCFGTTTPGQATTCIKCGQILNGGIITWSISDEAIIYNKEDDEY